MAKPKIDKIREERITMEIVVDAYNERDHFAGWLCYPEDKLEFPFRAGCATRREISPLLLLY